MTDSPTIASKPRLGFGQMWNISFGFFGIQIGFALQNANMSRIFQSLGTSLDDLPALWVAAPLTGLLVQPIIGHMSDRTWLGRLGRRRPYFLARGDPRRFVAVRHAAGAGLAVRGGDAVGAGRRLNISMEPFRAFVGDMLRKDQHSAGYAVQTAFIGAGAVVGSIVPWALEQSGVSNVAPDGGIPDTVRYAFWFGGAALFLAVLWTVMTTREYSPEEMAEFEGARAEERRRHDRPRCSPREASRSSAAWIAAGAIVLLGRRQLGAREGGLSARRTARSPTASPASSRSSAPAAAALPACSAISSAISPECPS